MNLPKIDPRELRQVLGAFVTGVTVITTIDAAGLSHGLTANSFSSVSLDPPLVLWSQALTAYSYPVFRDAERFAVNILADDQIDVSNRFARAGADKFGLTRVRAGRGDVPLIEGCSAYLECRRVAGYPAGDHMIFIGEVERIERTGRRPLVFGSGKYLIAQPHDFGMLSADQTSSNRSRLQAVRMATHAAVELSAQLDETIGLAVWGNHGPTVVHWELSKQPVSLNLRVGAVLPMLGSATGLAFAAWLSAAETSAFVAADLALAGGATSQSPVHDSESLETALTGIRASGLATLTTVSNFLDRSAVSVNAISAPVFDRCGQILLALTALGESDKLDISPEGRVAQPLKTCAAQLTRSISSR
jgi:flavin reductase (DIM6/NTAB) family NADH-FMN oxidoreductase RutF/DNA-binding IclR family transcriptional regulator